MTLPLFISKPLINLTWGLRNWLVRFRQKRERAGRAWRYLRRTLTADDASSLIYEAEHVKGEYSLESISVDSVLEDALERWEAAPCLERLVEEAVARVANKWESSGNISGGASEWAISLVKEYARDQGVKLIEVS